MGENHLARVITSISEVKNSAWMKPRASEVHGLSRRACLRESQGFAKQSAIYWFAGALLVASMDCGVVDMLARYLLIDLALALMGKSA